MGWMPHYWNEARIYAKYILKGKPNARIAMDVLLRLEDNAH